jgi:hypothetical protein
MVASFRVLAYLLLTSTCMAGPQPKPSGVSTGSWPASGASGSAPGAGHGFSYGNLQSQAIGAGLGLAASAAASVTRAVNLNKASRVLPIVAASVVTTVIDLTSDSTPPAKKPKLGAADTSPAAVNFQAPAVVATQPAVVATDAGLLATIMEGRGLCASRSTGVAALVAAGPRKTAPGELHGQLLPLYTGAAMAAAIGGFASTSSPPHPIIQVPDAGQMCTANMCFVMAHPPPWAEKLPPNGMAVAAYATPVSSVYRLGGGLMFSPAAAYAVNKYIADGTPIVETMAAVKHDGGKELVSLSPPILDWQPFNNLENTVVGTDGILITCEGGQNNAQVRAAEKMSAEIVLSNGISSFTQIQTGRAPSSPLCCRPIVSTSRRTCSILRLRLRASVRRGTSL